MAKVSTRGAIYCGDRLSEACLVLEVNGTLLRDAEVISTGTFSKLRRRYRGEAVEESTRNRVVDFLKDRLDDRSRSRLAALKLDIETDVLIPAWCQLTEQARIAASKVRSFVRTAGMKADHIDHTHIRKLLEGGFAVRKHIAPVAEHIFVQCQAKSIRLPNCESFEDLINEETFDHNVCSPLIYETLRRVRLPQLGLTGAGSVVAAE